MRSEISAAFRSSASIAAALVTSVAWLSGPAHAFQAAAGKVPVLHQTPVGTWIGNGGDFVQCGPRADAKPLVLDFLDLRLLLEDLLPTGLSPQDVIAKAELDSARYGEGRSIAQLLPMFAARAEEYYPLLARDALELSLYLRARMEGGPFDPTVGRLFYRLPHIIELRDENLASRVQSIMESNDCSTEQAAMFQLGGSEFNDLDLYAISYTQWHRADTFTRAALLWHESVYTVLKKREMPEIDDSYRVRLLVGHAIDLESDESNLQPIRACLWEPDMTLQQSVGCRFLRSQLLRSDG